MTRPAGRSCGRWRIGLPTAPAPSGSTHRLSLTCAAPAICHDGTLLPAIGYGPSSDRRHMTRIHRYPTRTLLADYGRGAVGAGISGTFGALSPVALYSMVFFGGLTALFLLFVMSTALRHRRGIVSDADGKGGGRHERVPWGVEEDLHRRTN